MMKIQNKNYNKIKKAQEKKAEKKKYFGKIDG